MSDGIDILLDGRRKLLPCQIERILFIREEYEYSYRKIAKLYFGDRITHQTIWLECSPRAKERAREKTRKLKADGRYYDTDKNTEQKIKNRSKKKVIEEIFNFNIHKNQNDEQEQE